jgi:hypothetical protein
VAPTAGMARWTPAVAAMTTSAEAAPDPSTVGAPWAPAPAPLPTCAPWRCASVPSQPPRLAWYPLQLSHSCLRSPPRGHYLWRHASGTSRRQPIVPPACFPLPRPATPLGLGALQFRAPFFRAAAAISAAAAAARAAVAVSRPTRARLR